MFQHWFANLPIKRKLFSLHLGILVVMSTISLTVILVLAVNLTSRTHNQATMDAIRVFYTNPNIIQSLQTEPNSAARTLEWLQAVPEVSSASLVIGDQLVSGFIKSGTAYQSATEDNFPFARATAMPLQDADPLITLYIVRDRWYTADVFMGASISIFFIVIGAFLLTLMSARIVKYSMINPIQHLIGTAVQVTSQEDFQVRATKYNDDEIGALVDRFNEMLVKIEARDHELQFEKHKSDRARQDAQKLAKETREANKRLEFEVHVRSKIETKLTDFQSYLNSIINSMPSALIALDAHLFVTLWNSKATQLSGTSLESALGYSVEEAFPFLEEYSKDIRQALIEQEHRLIEKVDYCDDTGKDYLLDLIVYPLDQTKGRGVVIRIDDVTEKYKLEEVIVQTEKMMSVGGLAAGMAHEINNPLSAIIQGIQNIERRLSVDLPQNKAAATAVDIDLEHMHQYLDQRRILHFLDNIRAAGQRAAHIVTNMLQFSRQTNRTLSVESMSDVVTQAIEIVSSEQFLSLGDTGSDLHILQNIQESTEHVNCVRQEIEQVIINLMKNGAQAIEQRANTAEPGFQGQLQVRVNYDKHFCHIQVEDNGIGMDNEVKKRVFEPFYTTKDIGVGTGLGLSVSYFIITSHHNGSLEVSSNPGQGSVFSISLPLSKRS